MNKTFNINPDLFTLHSKGTRKKTTKPKELKIKIPKEQNSTLSKRNMLLKFIRRHQEKNATKQQNDTNEANNDEVEGDFDESLKYLMDMTEKAENEKITKSKSSPNYTLKNQDGHHVDENVSMIFPGSENDLVPVVLPVFHSSLPKMQLATPKYGCLKNGTLPTYRQFHRGQQTQKNTEYVVQGGEYKDTLGNKSETDIKRKYAPLRYPSQKRILRRTFRVGKSDKHRKVSVLVSNRTLRHQVSNKNQLLKQTPIIEVKRYLVKHGLIKIGSTAPPDVLRKMYESSSLMCGEIKNHNSEFLMYNFLNGEKKTW
jgi:hypothetical protein